MSASPTPLTARGPEWDRALEAMVDAPHRYEFYQTVRYLLRRYRALYPDREPPPTLREVVRFTSQVTMRFPPSDLVALETHLPETPGSATPTAELEVAFMGLAGHQAPLPDHYAEHILQQRRRRDRSFESFLNLFNNRLVDLFYQSWEKPRFYVPAERGDGDPLTEALFSLQGFASRRLRDALPVPASLLLGHVTTALKRPVSLETLEQVLTSYLGDTPLRVIPFVGRWVELETESRTCLSDDPEPPTLGALIPLGERVWDVQGQIRLELGPLEAERLQTFLPGGAEHHRLIELTRVLCGAHIEVELRLILPAEAIPEASLGDCPSSTGTRLGAGAWLGRPPGAHRAVLDLAGDGLRARWI